MDKKDLVYYPVSQFNGVLIILREPHSNNGSADADFEGCQQWFNEILSNRNLSRKQSRYRNRFCEMLTFCGQSSSELEHVAYTNIKRGGGGASASKAYWDISYLEKKAILEDITDCVKPEIVFVCKDAFDVIAEGQEVSRTGIKYSNLPLRRTAAINGVKYFEILHPSRSPRIKY